MNMNKWKLGKARAHQFNTQLYVMPVITEAGKKEEVLFYASNINILTQVIEEHNKLIDIYKDNIKKEKKNVG